jgi:putative transposase
MNYRLIEAIKPQRSVSRLCSTLEVSRSGFYAWVSRPPCERKLTDAALTEKIKEIHTGSGNRYGAPKIHAELADEHDICVGKKRVARLMKKEGIVGVMRGRKWRTTISDPAAAPAPDLVDRAFVASAPNELWLADLTYVPTATGFLYLAVIIDMFSRMVVGWSMRSDMRADLVVDALSMAVARRQPEGGLVHHSDRGSQYTSLAFATKLEAFDITASMGSRGDAYDNAVAESFMAIIKTELTKRCRFANHSQARVAIFDYIEGFYNRRRRHSALGYKSPLNFEKIHATLSSDKAKAA